MGASSIQSVRKRACVHQEWHCHFCGLPMLASSAPDAKRMPGLRESAEHLVAKQHGGGNERSNIVAAHVVCNQRRHARARELSPEAFQIMVRSRLAKGRWHPESVLRVLVSVSNRP